MERASSDGQCMQGQGLVAKGLRCKRHRYRCDRPRYLSETPSIMVFTWLFYLHKLELHKYFKRRSSIFLEQTYIVDGCLESWTLLEFLLLRLRAVDGCFHPPRPPPPPYHLLVRPVDHQLLLSGYYSTSCIIRLFLPFP